MAETEHTVCILCDLEIEENDKLRISVTAKESLIKASKEIGDRKHLKMKDLPFLEVHKSCQSMYTRPSHIKRQKQAISEKLAQLRRDNKEARKFDFSRLCVFCGLDAMSDNHKRPIKLVCSDDVKDNILQELESRSDDNDFDKKLKLRLQHADDLKNKNARYHAKCMSLFYSKRATKTVGRPMNENTSAVVTHIINHILANGDDSQFSLKELIEGFRDNLPRIDLIKEHVKNYFEDDVIMYNAPNDTIICFVNRQGKILDNQWYEKKAPSEEEERLRVVEMAANIICQDIRMKQYDTQMYKAPSSFLDDVAEDVPKSLEVFLETIIKSNKRSEESLENKWSKRVLTIAHILISCVRPRTFLSPLLLGLSSFIHKKFAARGLVDTFSYLGLCASYHETLRFESSVVNDPEEIIKKISCSCASGCKTKVCGCRKNALKCTSVCKHCDETQCENFEKPNIVIDDGEDDESVNAFDTMPLETVLDTFSQEESESESESEIPSKKSRFTFDD